MKTIIFSIVSFSLLALPAHAERVCRAILLDNSGSHLCEMVDTELQNVTDEEFNNLVCNPAVLRFQIGNQGIGAGVAILDRIPESGGLLTEDCEFEVRANSGSH